MSDHGTEAEQAVDEGASLACRIDLVPVDPEPGFRHRTLAEAVLNGFLEMRELPSGYALRYPSDAASIMTLAEWITTERSCCGFLSFAIQVEPEGGAVWLQLSGPTGTKEMLSALLTRADAPPAAGVAAPDASRAQP